MTQTTFTFCSDLNLYRLLSRYHGINKIISFCRRWSLASIILMKKYEQQLCLKTQNRSLILLIHRLLMDWQSQENKFNLLKLSLNCLVICKKHMRKWMTLFRTFRLITMDFLMTFKWHQLQTRISFIVFKQQRLINS